MLTRIRKWMEPLRNTILHPQWLSIRRKEIAPLFDSLPARGRVLDVGCADSWPRQELPASLEYFGLDYPETATGWYGTKPDIYADAAALPVRDGGVDAVFMFDLLEHLEQPEQAISEAFRVLKPGGLLLMNTPFLYPLHDEPRDYRRWTRHGHVALAASTGFIVERLDEVGSPLRSAFLLLNIALAKCCINGLRKRHPATILLPLLPFAVVTNNILAWLLGLIEPSDSIMPVSYRAIWRKPG